MKKRNGVEMWNGSNKWLGENESNKRQYVMKKVNASAVYGMTRIGNGMAK